MNPQRSPTIVLAFAAALSWLAETHAELKTAREVRLLTAEQADQAKPVEVEGIVIFSDPPSTAFLQDESAGTFFRLEGKPAPKPGDRVRVRGRTFPGLYLSGIEETEFEVLGFEGLPEAIPVAFDDLMSGRFHYQRVSVEGVVRALRPDAEGASVLELALGTRVLLVEIDSPMNQATGWTDRFIRVTGLAAGRINSRRQLVTPYLRCRDWNDLEVLREASMPGTIPRLSAHELLAFSADGSDGHRVRLEGTVLARIGRSIFLRDEEAAVEVVPAEAESLAIRVGERIEVIGFPRMERFSASIVDARIRILSVGEDPLLEPKPIRITAQEFRAGAYDSDLVRVQGTILDRYRGESDAVILLRSDGLTLRAKTPDTSREVAPGSVTEMIGICRVEETVGSEYRSQPASVSLLLRSPSDLTVIERPPWWTAPRLMAAVTGLLLVLLFGTLWISLLRRQVRQRTKSLEESIKGEAILEDRQRIAREFHDTLEQDLAGLVLRLDAATTRAEDETLHGFLDGSRRLVARIQSETRNLVSDLREAREGPATLPEELADLVEEPSRQPGPRLILAGDPVPLLPPRTTHHLKMIAREALTNVIKHAGASEVVVTTHLEEDSLLLRVSDDGSGLSSPSDTEGIPGHFGCMGIRERARRIGAEVTWESDEGKGTCVKVTLPRCQFES